MGAPGRLGRRSSAALDELEAIADRIDELRADLTVAAGSPLPQDFAEIWSSSTTLVQGAVRFLKTFAGGRGPPAFGLEAAAEELHEGSLRLQGARLRAHAALADEGRRLDEDAEEGCAALRAHCPRCDELYRWAPDYYAGVARGAAGEWLKEQRRERVRRDESLRREVAEERRRLRHLVEEELGDFFSLGSSTPPRAGREEAAPGFGEEPRQVLDALRRRAEALRRAQRRREAADQLAELARRAADEVMEAVDVHLEEAWSSSVAAWAEGVRGGARDDVSAEIAAAVLRAAAAGRLSPRSGLPSPPAETAGLHILQRATDGAARGSAADAAALPLAWRSGSRSPRTWDGIGRDALSPGIVADLVAASLSPRRARSLRESPRQSPRPAEPAGSPRAQTSYGLS